MTALLVYAVVRAGDRPAGLLPESLMAGVRLVEGDGLAAVTSPAPRGAAARMRSGAAARHHRIVQALVGAGTVLPMRLGTVVEGERAVREELLARGEVRALLDSLDGRVQLTVRAEYVGETAAREAAAAEPPLRRETERLDAEDPDMEAGARIVLAGRFAEAVEAVRRRDEALLCARLCRVADELQSDAPSHEGEVARVHLLVRRERLPDADAAVARLACEQQDRLHLRYLGPLAPYAFADLRLQESWA